jgi:hypothetical protein
VGYTRELYNPGSLQCDSVRADMIEQFPATSEQYGRQVDLDLVQQSGTQALLNEIEC